MTTRPARLALLASYQLMVLFGVLVMPVALLARQLGVPVPYDRLLDAFEGRLE